MANVCIALDKQREAPCVPACSQETRWRHAPDAMNYKIAMRVSTVDDYVISQLIFFFFQAEDGIRDLTVTGVQTCALPIFGQHEHAEADGVVAVEAQQARVIFRAELGAADVLERDQRAVAAALQDHALELGDRKSVV